jgi:hypothetical protein
MQALLSLCLAVGAPTRLVSVATLLPWASGFVLTPANFTSISTLPGSAYRWTMPASSDSTAGLGNGLSWALEAQFCDQMVPLFPENDGMFGLVEFVSCTEIKAAVARAFATWADNHQVLSFVDVTDSVVCSGGATGDLYEACPWELLVGTGDGLEYPTLAAFVINYRKSHFDSLWWQKTTRSTAGVSANGVDQMQRSKMTLQKHICWCGFTVCTLPIASLDGCSALPTSACRSPRPRNDGPDRTGTWTPPSARR